MENGGDEKQRAKTNMQRDPLVLAQAPECPVGPIGNASGWGDIEYSSCNGQDNKGKSRQK